MPEQPFGFPQMYPPGSSALDAALEEELMGTDYDTGMPDDQPGYFYGEDGFFDQGNMPLGGPGNPIDYNAPWNVGPYQSFPMYEPGPALPPAQQLPPFFGQPNPPPFGFSEYGQGQFDMGNPYPQMDEYDSILPGGLAPPAAGPPQFIPAPGGINPNLKMWNPVALPPGFPGLPQLMPNPFLPPNPEQLQPMTQQFPAVPYGQQLQGLAGYV